MAVGYQSRLLGGSEASQLYLGMLLDSLLGARRSLDQRPSEREADY